MSVFSFGPVLTEKGVLFRFWAPLHSSIQLLLENRSPLAMDASPDGWHSLLVDDAQAGSRYCFILPSGLKVPDPASRFQPEGVHGKSEVVHPYAYEWKNDEWRGRPWEETVFYQIHIGTLTPEGTFRAAISKLDDLQALGVTALQLMPIHDFSGRWGWSYDGVLPYAPATAYGRPDDLKAFIDAAHQRGLSVFLDVVYNHFGPDGNYLPSYAPIFTERHQTPWGAGINYDGKSATPIREFMIQNAVYWITEFRADGLRFDAVHAIVDDSAQHILKEITGRVREATQGRHVHLAVENEDNDGALLVRDQMHKPRYFTAQWNDDFHHALHVAVTGETFGYYDDYRDHQNMLGRALAEGFAFQGEMMAYRGSHRGEPSAHLPPTAFVSFLQNHDQIGNRGFGDRISNIASAQALRAAAALYLLAPQIPMIFMGEEWQTKAPFPYFCDFDEDLNEKVRQGRRRELSRLPGFHDEKLVNAVPDPTSETTFHSAKLNWQERNEAPHATWLDLYTRLLEIRQREIVPLLRHTVQQSRYETDGCLQVSWDFDNKKQLKLLANLHDTNITLAQKHGGSLLWCEGSYHDQTLGPWTVTWLLN